MNHMADEASGSDSYRRLQKRSILFLQNQRKGTATSRLFCYEKLK